MRPFRFSLFLLLFMALNFWSLKAQPNFRVEIEEVQWAQAPALHSFACGVYEGKWVFIGGRTNGLHGFLAPLAFPNNGRNPDIIVFDPSTGLRWDQPLSVLPDSIREPLMSSNMQFHQVDSFLYVVGGYGWKAAQADFITYPTLTAVTLPGLIQAIQTQTPVNGYFRQIQDSSFAICGAHLARIDTTFHLVFGHRFDGIYDRQDTTGFHVQRYSYANRSFGIQDDGQQLSVSWHPEQIDSVHFRRRDYNLVPQVFPDGSEGYTAFSGVFQKGINLPYLHSIDLLADTIIPRLGVDQQLANYHSAVVPVYDSITKKMSTIFLGGEAMYYYDSTGTFTLDSLVPFVNTISIMNREASGTVQEYVADTTLLGLLGSNAQFFPLDTTFIDHRGIVRLDKLQGRTLVGHMMGGIESPEPNISDTDPAMSWATNRVFEIYLVPVSTNLTESSQSVLAPASLKIIDNPYQGATRVQIEGEPGQSSSLELMDARGRHLGMIWSGELGGIREIHVGTELSSGMYYLRLRAGDYMVIKRMVKIAK